MTVEALLKLFWHARHIGRGLLSFPHVVFQARKVIQLAEQNNNTDELSLNYDERNPFVVCAETMKPIYRGKEQIRCSYCYQPYLPACRGHTCTVCLIGTVGGEATGMVNCYSQLR